MKSTKTLVPFRMPPEWDTTLDELRSYVGFTKQLMLNDALSLYMGKRDPLAEERGRMVRKAIKAGKVPRPFEQGRSSVLAAA